MGFFKKLFSDDIDEYPPLDQNSPAARQMEELRSNIEELAEKLQAPMEVVPGEGKALIFAGEPPKDFGIFMLDSKYVSNLKELAEYSGMSEEELTRLTQLLRNAYMQSKEHPRFSTDMADGKVTVLLWPDLINEVKKLVLES